MNLVLSGPQASSLLATIKSLTKPSNVLPISPNAWRLEQVEESTPTRLQVATCCASAAVDHAYIEPGVRFSGMKLLVLDMDSTLITMECIDELADYAGKKSEVSSITESTMRGEFKDFEHSLRSRVALLKGLDADVLQLVYEERLRLSPGAQTLIDAAHAAGVYIVIVSGGFTYFAERLKNELHLDAAYANDLETSNGKLTGRVVGTIVNASSKAARVEEAMRRVNCERTQAIVIGDGANDIPMMQCVAYSVAYRAKPLVQQAARLQITYGSLATTLTYFS